MDRKRFAEEATRLAIEAVERGSGGPFGAVVVKGDEIVGRGQNRVLLTGCPVYHAEITAIIDACARLNLGSGVEGDGRALPTLEPEVDAGAPGGGRARMLTGCEIYSNAAPCPMCMSAIYWARIDRVYFGADLEDARAIGFDDAAQYEDFALPWDRRRLPIVPHFERELCLAAFRVWREKRDRRRY